MIPELKALLDQGYVFGSPGKCTGCGAKILWFRSPAQKPAPFDPITYVSHWATCPKADLFRRTRREKKKAVRCLRIVNRPGKPPLIIADGQVLPDDTFSRPSGDLGPNWKKGNVTDDQKPLFDEENPE